ncbi:MAG: hypothetical protein WCJ34_08410 [Alcaligenaceae bacterium]
MAGSTPATGAQLFKRFAQAAATFSKPRAVRADMLLQFDELAVLVRIREGRVSEILERGVALQSWDFAVKGTAEAWSKFWLATPPAGWHDLLALNKRQAFVIEGNLHPLMAHLQFIKDLLASPREVIA